MTSVPISRKRYLTSWIMSGLPVLFLLFDAATKIIKLPPVIEASAKLGFSADSIQGIGFTLLLCAMLYVIPRTSILGAILLTGYLGGAVATNVRADSPLFSNILFPVYFGILIWGGLFLREDRLSTLIPIRKTNMSE